MDEYLKHSIKQKKNPYTKQHILHESIYVKYKKWQNYSVGSQDSGYPWEGYWPEEEWGDS